MEDANELAWAIEGMQCDDGELLKYRRFFLWNSPGTMQEALRYAMNLDDYERIPEDAYEYGQTVLRRIGADDELIDTIDRVYGFREAGRGRHGGGRSPAHGIWPDSPVQQPLC